MTNLKPCPFCGELPELRGMGTLVYHKSCFNRILFDIDFWNTRNGEPKKCCANCKHCDVWDQGFDETPYIKCGNPEKRDDWGKDHDLPRGVIVCEKWESVVKWEEEE